MKPDLMQTPEAVKKEDWKSYYFHHEARHAFFPQTTSIFGPYDPKKRWDGKKSLRKKRIVVVAEQGHGDNIQFARYIQFLKKCEIVCHTYDTLLTLMERQPYVDWVRTSPPKHYDYWCPLISLPHVLKLDTLPGEPFVFLNEKTVVEVPVSPKIGVVWAGNPKFGGDQGRSCPFKEFGPIVALGAIYSLQVNKSPRAYNNDPGKVIDLAAHPDEWSIIDAEPYLTDFRKTASWINALDWVVSVDTATLHLAGAMGKKCVGLLPKLCDPRWGEKDVTPWYPSMRLCRQDDPGEWGPAVQKAAKVISCES